MLSLDKFKKVAQDQDTVTMRHEDGHEMKIMLKGIGSSIQREQLKRLKMAEGGEVDKGLLGHAKSLSRKGDKSEKGVHKATKADPKGGKSVAHEYAEFAPNSPMSGMDEAKRIHKGVLHEIRTNPKPRGEYKDGGKVQNFDEGTGDSGAQAPVDQPAAPAQAPVVVNVGTQPAAQAPVPAAPAQPVAPVIPAQAPVQGLQENPALLESAKGTSTVEGAAGTQSKAAALNEQAENTKAQIAQVGAQEAFQVAQFKQKAAEAAQFENQQSVQDLGQRAQAATDYINTHPVDRNQIFKEMGVGGKIATSLGLLFGGFKSGFSGGNNPAMDWLMSQQQKSIDSQIQNIGNQKSLIDAYDKIFHNRQASIEMAKKNWNDQALAVGDQVAAQLGTPQANVARDSLKAKLLQDSYERLQNASFFTRQGGSSGGQPQNPASVPSGQKRSIEGVGQQGALQYGPKSADKAGVYNIQPLLIQDYQYKLTDLQRRASRDPAAAAELSEVMPALRTAFQTDQMLAQVPRLFRELIANGTYGQLVGNNISGTDVGAATLPIAGGAVATALGAVGSKAELLTHSFEPGTDDKNTSFRMAENYKIAANQLSDIIKRLYPGITGAERTNTLQGILSDIRSNPGNITKHIKSFEDLAKSGTSVRALKTNGFLNEGTLD